MLVRPPRRSRGQVQVPLTSLIDMVFLLLIYFLLTTNFMVEEGIDIKLPNADAAGFLPEGVITVNIDKLGRIFIDNMEQEEKFLPDRLSEILSGGDDKLVVVKADRAATLDKVVTVIDIAKAAGAERLSLATEKETR